MRKSSHSTKRTNAHTQMHTHTHTQHKQAQARKRKRERARDRARTREIKRATRTYAHIQTHRHTDTQTHRHTDTQTHAYTDTHAHAHTHTCTHTHETTHHMRACSAYIMQRYTHCTIDRSVSVRVRVRQLFSWKIQCALLGHVFTSMRMVYAVFMHANFRVYVRVCVCDDIPKKTKIFGKYNAHCPVK